MLLRKLKNYLVMTVPAVASFGVLAGKGMFSKSIDTDVYPNLPKSAEEFNSFSFANEKLGNLYSQNLINAKNEGNVSDELLTQLDLTDKAQVEDLLTSLYEAGKEGSIEAQNRFNEIASAYANDFYMQASNQTYLDLTCSLPHETFDLLGNIQDNPILFAGAVGLAALGIVIGAKMISNDRYR